MRTFNEQCPTGSGQLALASASVYAPQGGGIMPDVAASAPCGVTTREKSHDASMGRRRASGTRKEDAGTPRKRGLPPWHSWECVPTLMAGMTTRSEHHGRNRC